MAIHNKKKKFVLGVAHAFIELLCLPQRIFSKKVNLKEFNPRKILLLRLDHIGDIVMTSPAFSVLRERFPTSEIILLTGSAGKQLYLKDPHIDRVLEFNWPWSHRPDERGFSISKLKELWQLVIQLRKEQVDVLVDFRGDLRFVVLFGLLSGIKIRISNSRSGQSSLLHAYSNYEVDRHEVERSLDVIKCLAPVISGVRTRVFLEQDEVYAIKQLLEKAIGMPFPEKLALIAPYSSKDVKSWPDGHFKEVIAYLRKRNFTVIVVGAPENAEHAGNLIEGFSEHVFSMAGKTNIRELAALTSVSTLLVGVDTGVLHIASGFDVPVLAIFGSTRSVEFRPYSPFARVIESNTCQCNQFLHIKCDYPEGNYAKCLQDVSPAAVINALEETI